MKKNIKAVLIAVLAIVLTLGMATAAFASGGQIAGQGGGTISAERNDYSSSCTVEFVAGDNYELTAAPGTTTEKDGSVTVTLSTKKIPGKLVPQIEGADKYYEIKGWAIKNAYGELEEIDLAEYTFTKSKTEVYPIVADIWVPYIDMKQDRSDWFYEYVRDLSVA